MDTKLKINENSSNYEIDKFINNKY